MTKSQVSFDWKVIIMMIHMLSVFPDILFDNIICNTFRTECTIPDGPKVTPPILLPQMWEFLLDLTRGSSFE